MPKANSVTGDSISRKVEDELYRQLMETAFGTGIIIPVATLLLAMLLRAHIPLAYLVTWLAAMISLSSARLFTARRYSGSVEAGTREQLQRRLFVTLTFLIGIAWSALALLPGALSSVYTQAVIYLTATGVIMLGVNVLNMNRTAMTVYVCPLPVVLVIAWNSSPHAVEWAPELSAIMVAGLLFMLWTGTQNNRIMQHNLALRFTNEELVSRLRESNRDARAASEAKSFFLANMSHEIRTPMNAIIGLSRLLQSTRLNGRQQKLVDTIRTAADSLLALLNNILDLSKIEAGQLQLERVSFRLDELLESVRLTMEPLAGQKGIELLVESDPDGLPEYVRGDETRLRQVLFNLVNNAIKFTDQGSVVIMAKAMTPDQADGDIPMLFSVVDTGAGIPAEKEAMIFENFTQADASTARKYGGSGLGLTISRQLIELMGGRIWLSSKPGHGTTFSFTVTLTPGARPAEPSRPASLAPRDKPLQILLVEDNGFNQYIIRELLESRKHNVDVAGKDYDLVLMDVQMPVMDGITACEVIRSAENDARFEAELPDKLPGRLVSRLRRKHLPITALTANAMTDDREACRNAGMDSYLTKPFTPEQLFEAIMTAVRSRRSPA